MKNLAGISQGLMGLFLAVGIALSGYFVSNLLLNANTEFAKAANVKVGGIETARQGNFMINDANEEYTTSTKIEKDVRVVTTIKFYLTN